MSPEEMGQLQAAAGKDQSGNAGVMEKVQAVGKGLSELAQILQRSGGSPEENDQMAQILNSYIDLVEKKLGGQEEQGEPANEGPSEVAQEAGVKGIPMNQNMKM